MEPEAPLDTPGKRLKWARKWAKLTQPQLADRIGYASQGGIGNLEQGKNRIAAPIARRVEKELGVRAEWILYGDPAPRFADDRPAKPHGTLDERVAQLPDALQEYVLQALALAERSATLIPAQFLRAPDSQSLAAFHRYLESLSEKLKATAQPKGGE